MVWVMAAKRLAREEGDGGDGLRVTNKRSRHVDDHAMLTFPDLGRM
jgi:hypothetical protein